MKKEIPAPIKCDRPKPYLSLDSEYLPEIKNWKVGGTYTVTAKIKMKSLNESEDGMSASFDVLEINDKAFSDKSYKDLMDEESKEGE